MLIRKTQMNDNCFLFRLSLLLPVVKVYEKGSLKIQLRSRRDHHLLFFWIDLCLLYDSNLHFQQL